MFRRPVCQVAAPGALSTVADCILFNLDNSCRFAVVIVKKLSYRRRNALCHAVELEILGSQKFKLGHVTRTMHAPFTVDLSSVDCDLIYPTCVQNLTTLASAVLVVWLVTRNFKTVHMIHLTWPRPFHKCFVIRWLGLDTINLATTFKICISINYECIKGDTKCGNCDGLG